MAHLVLKFAKSPVDHGYAGRRSIVRRIVGADVLILVLKKKYSVG